MALMCSRRDFTATLSAAGAATLLGGRGALADEGPPETTTVRLLSNTSICEAPGFISDDLLRAEGFEDIRYVDAASVPLDAAARGEVDFEFNPPPLLASLLDAGAPLLAVGGVHAGCYELFAHEPIRSIRDLKGRTAGVNGVPSAGYLQTAAMVAEVGLDPLKDIVWVTRPSTTAMDLFVRREVDAVIGFPPVPQELRARKVGRVIVSTTIDKPWSQYLCCILVGNRNYVRKYPNATKRFMHATLKAADLCAAAPDIAARRLVDRGFTPSYDLALQTLTELPYGSWRDFNVEDALRFYALRLHAVGMIKSDPKRLVADGTDWRFFNELKRELKV